MRRRLCCTSASRWAGASWEDSAAGQGGVSCCVVLHSGAGRCVVCCVHTLGPGWQGCRAQDGPRERWVAGIWTMLPSPGLLQGWSTGKHSHFLKEAAEKQGRVAACSSWGVGRTLGMGRGGKSANVADALYPVLYRCADILLYCCTAVLLCRRCATTATRTASTSLPLPRFRQRGSPSAVRG